VKGLARPGSILEGIEEIHTKQGEIGRIACGNLQSMNTRSSGNHVIFFKKMLGPACHKPGPFAKASCVHGEQVAGSFYLVEPDFDFSSLVRDLPSSAFDTALEFPDGDSGDIDLIFAKTLQPSLRPRRVPLVCGVRKGRWCPADNGSLEFHDPAALQRAAFRS